MSGQFAIPGAKRAVLAGVGGAATAIDVYLALATAEPMVLPASCSLADFVANEITTTGYARQEVTWAELAAIYGAQIDNDAVIEFGPFTADPPEVTHCFLTDAASGTTGEVLAFWALTTPRNAAAGDVLRCNIKDLNISVT